MAVGVNVGGSCIAVAVASGKFVAGGKVVAEGAIVTVGVPVGTAVAVNIAVGATVAVAGARLHEVVVRRTAMVRTARRLFVGRFISSSLTNSLRR